jgi:polyhydroxyalkanoate synthase subunit PhaC
MTEKPGATAVVDELAKLIDTQRRLAETARQLAVTRDRDVDLATTPKTEVLRIGDKVLYHCSRPDGSAAPGPAVLVAYALVGRYTVLDLQPDRSFVGGLLEAGLDVYVIDWGHPNRACRYDDLGDYVDGYLDAFVDGVRAETGQDAINLLGICQGGVLSLCYSALFPEKVRNLVLTVTPVDFHADQEEPHPGRGFMNVWARSLEEADIDLVVETLGNFPGDIGGVAFTMMTPMRSLAKYNLTLVEASQDEAKLMNFLRMEKWLADRPAHAGAAARQWLHDLYRENRLLRGELVLCGRRVDLGKVQMPILNIYTETDHIIPPPMTRALRGRTGTSDYTEFVAKGGHIGVMVAGGSTRRQLREEISGWIAARQDARQPAS